MFIHDVFLRVRQNINLHDRSRLNRRNKLVKGRINNDALLRLISLALPGSDTYSISNFPDYYDERNA